MEQNLKELLLKDLCGRLPYEVIVTDNRHGNSVITEIDTVSNTVYCSDFDEYVPIEKCLPYFRPLSSMTEEEKEEYENCYQSDDTTTATLLVDFYNRKHLDYRGLIEKNLALEAPKDMYDSSNKVD